MGVFTVASATGLNDKHPHATPFFLFITIISSTDAPRQTREKKKSVAEKEKIKLPALKCILRSVSSNQLNPYTWINTSEKVSRI